MKGTWQTTSGGGSGGLGQVVLVAVAAVAAVALIGPVVAAVVSLVKALVIAVVAVVIMGASIGGLVLWLRPRHPRGLPVRTARELHAAMPHAIPAPQRAIEPPQALHLHFHGVDAGDVAAIIRRHGEQS